MDVNNYDKEKSKQKRNNVNNQNNSIVLFPVTNIEE